MARGLVVALMLANIASFGLAVHRRFVTEGESRALVAGVSHWTEGDFGLADDTPPLARTVATLPVLCLQPKVRGMQRRDQCLDPATWSRFEDRMACDFAGALLPDDYLDMVRLGRLAGCSWWLLGAWVIFRWSQESLGDEAGWMALSLWSIAPNVMAAESVIDSALPAAVSATIASYAWLRFSRQPSASKSVVAGSLLGVALLADYALIALTVVWAIPWGLTRFLSKRNHTDKRRIGRWFAWATAMLISCLWVIHQGFGFQSRWQYLGDYQFISGPLAGELPPERPAEGWDGERSGNRFRGNLLGSFLVFLPQEYLQGLDRRLWETRKYSAMGPDKRQDQSHRAATLLAARTPIGMVVLLLWALSLMAWYRKPGRLGWSCDLIPWVAIGLIMTATTLIPGFVPPDRGLVLMAPFATIGASRLAIYFTERRSWASVAVILLGSWIAVSGFGAAWGGQSYLNEAFGGSTDWSAQLAYGRGDGGSDLLLLKEWIDHHPEAQPVRVAVQHVIQLKPFGIANDLIPIGAHGSLANNLSWVQRPELEPGSYALDAEMIRSDYYAHFRDLRPEVLVGRTIAIYQLSKDQADRVRHDRGLLPHDTPVRGPIESRGFVRKVFRDETGEASHYTVFIPFSYKEDRPYPMIVFLHGGGDAGMEGEQYLRVGLPPAIEDRKESFEFITVIPQGRTGNWVPGSWDANRALSIIDRVQKDYRVDPKRIYLTGLSSGGTGVWSMAERYPHRWAAIVPIATAACDATTAQRIKDIPCWCFHNVNDSGSPPEIPRVMIAAIRQAGGQPRYWESFFPATTGEEQHNAWDAAYRNPQLYGWLLTHRLP